MCTVFVAPPMGFSFLLCFLVTVLAQYCSALVSKEVAYECGPHGKFEYCIDELAGCVVGCHCHPGYYFDTDTKICEPNMKLMQHYRRQYLPEPTPTTTAHPTYQTYPTYPTPTATEHLNNKNLGVIKDTDELGDWLYNQFFKTIESQIISNSNKTKSNSDEKPPTRRSGGEPVISKSKRKSGKSIKGRKKRKHAKERGLTRKLLRITEDDSLFDDSDSDSDNSYSSGSDSESQSDDESSESDKSDGKKSSDTDCGDDHGHKKVIIFNRRPKPPLPSFIFLPSMDTPYYPPIGLPPPPLVPMYPMVPVPPMAPMFPPFPGSTKSDDESSKSTTTVSDTNSTEATTTTPQSTTVEETTSESSTTVSSTEHTNAPEPGIRRNRPGKHLRISNLKKMLARANGHGNQKKLNSRQSKLMQMYLEKLKEIGRQELSATHEKSPEEILDEHLNSDAIPNISEDDTPHIRLQQEDQEETYVPRLEDVDFKYLSELIHRVNQSKSRSSPTLPFHLTEDLKELQKLQSSVPTRRNIGSKNPPRKVHRRGPDDIYYSNLGRQLASIIRNADSEVELQFTKGSEHANSKNQFHSVLNENSFLPRSFWERSIRSPVLQNGPLSEYLDETRTLKHNNEKRLINLENEVEMYASTPHPLSLQDLENILNTIRKAYAQFRQPMTSTKQSNVSMNVNLLPKHIRPAGRHNILFGALEKVEYISEHPETPVPSIVYVELHPAVATNASVFHEPETKYKVPYSDYWMFNPETVQQETKPRPGFNQTNKPIMHHNQVYDTNRMRQPFVGVVRPIHKDTNNSRGVYLHFLKSRPPIKQTTRKKHETKVEKNKKLNYFSGNQHYMFDDAVSYPLQQQQLLVSLLKTPISKRMRSKPSYFHNQLLDRSEYFN